MKLDQNRRYPYSAIINRPDYSWPNGSKLAVYIGLNIEHFAFGTGLGAQLVPGSGVGPDVLNYSWRDYGNRVGVWRLASLFEKLKFPVSLLVNTAIYDYCPEVIERFRDRGDEIVAHGRTNSETQDGLSEKDEFQLIAETTERITEEEGRPPEGWLGPWISETMKTPDILQENGYKYLLDWCHDDQPTWMKTCGGEILSVPYPQELNDIPSIMVRKNSAEQFAKIITDNFDEMLEQSRQQPLVMGIALHAYIVGQPFRLKHLKNALLHISRKRENIWFATAGQIAAHARTMNIRTPNVS